MFLVCFLTILFLFCTSQQITLSLSSEQKLDLLFEFVEYVFCEVVKLDTVEGWQALYLYLVGRTRQNSAVCRPSTWPVLFLATIQLLQQSCPLRVGVVDGRHEVLRTLLSLLNAELNVQDGSCGLSPPTCPTTDPFSIDSVRERLKRAGRRNDTRFLISLPSAKDFPEQCRRKSQSIMSSTSLAEAKGWPSFLCAFLDKIRPDSKKMHMRKNNRYPPARDLLKMGKLLAANAAMQVLQEDEQKTFSDEIRNCVPKFPKKFPNNDVERSRRMYDSGGRDLKNKPNPLCGVVRFATERIWLVLQISSHV